MYFWYKLLTYLFYPFTPFFLFLRKLKKKEHSIRYKEKLSQINTPRGEGFLIWFHVVSVGEAISILPLIENFEQDEKIKRILITSITVSSAEVFKNFHLENVFFDILPLTINKGIFLSLIWKIKFGQISESIKIDKLGDQCFKNFFTNLGISKGKN